MDDNDQSVTFWILQLRQNEPSAAQKIWERYYSQLVEVARSRLGGASQRVLDEEDIASRVIEQLWSGIQDNRFPQLENRDDLWHILLMLTKRRTIDAMRRNNTLQRREIGESALFANTPINEARLANLVADQSIAPEFAHDFFSDLEHLLGTLDDQRLVDTAVYKLQGFTNLEIAEELQCAERTIERKLKLIRDKIRLNN